MEVREQRTLAHRNTEGPLQTNSRYLPCLCSWPIRSTPLFSSRDARLAATALFQIYITISKSRTSLSPLAQQSLMQDVHSIQDEPSPVVTRVSNMFSASWVLPT